jgi:hypothetical protein
MIRRSFLTRTLGAIAGAVCAPFVGKAAGAPDNCALTRGFRREPIPHYNITLEYGRSYEIKCYGTATLRYDGKVVAELKPGDHFYWEPPLPKSPARNLHKLDELVNNIYRKQAEQARLAADPGAT